MRTTTELSRRSSSIPFFLTLILLGASIAACRDNNPQQEPRGDTTPTNRLSDAVPTPDSAIATIDSGLAGGTVTPGEHAVASTAGAPGWSKSELVEGVGTFIRSIDSNDRNAFFGSLSARSKAMMASDRTITQDRVWEGARNSLGDIQNRRISVVGGSRDSVAIEITGKRMVDGQRVDDPVVIQLLRESGTWKVIYPGLLYPGHILHR